MGINEMADNFNRNERARIRVEREKLKIAFSEALELYERLNDSERLAKLLEAEDTYLHYTEQHD